MLLKAAEFLTKIVKKGCPQPGFEPGAFQKAKKVSFFFKAFPLSHEGITYYTIKILFQDF
jgi:hypothetical protein